MVSFRSMSYGGGGVAAGHVAVAAAGAGVLDRGGNAVDAAVAAGFAAAVAEPGLTSLAGGGFALVRLAGADPEVFDFFVDHPGAGARPTSPVFDEVVVRFSGADQVFHCGPGSIAVPGCLPGYVAIHRAHGRLLLAEVVASAVDLAHRGVEVAPAQATVLGLLEPIISRSDDMRRVLAPKGHLLRPGDTLRNPDLAELMFAVGRGEASDFAHGDLRSALLGITAGGKGALSGDDLDRYSVHVRAPLDTPFLGRHVFTNPAPSFGGPLIVATLRRLADAIGGDPTLASDVAALDGVLAAALKWVDRHRERLLEEDRSWQTLAPSGRGTSRGTTQVSAADAEGNVVSMTTSNGECSGDVIPATGIFTNNMLGEDDLHPDGFHVGAPGTRVASMMAPTLVMGDGGACELVIGSGGSKRIRSAIVQVLVNRFVRGFDLRAAVEAPRLHWDVDHVEAEPGRSTAAVDAVGAAVDAPVRVWGERALYFGGTHVVEPRGGPDGETIGAGDPRRDGAFQRSVIG